MNGVDGGHSATERPEQAEQTELITRIEHIVWDWNGTLLADSDLIISATCETLAAFGYPAPTADLYRRLFTHPVTLFYERLLGRPVPAEEMLRIDTAFVDVYNSRVHDCDLAPGAREVTADWLARGRTQSVLSLSGHERLLANVRRRGIHDLFVRIEGQQQGTMVPHKAEMLARHLAVISADPDRTVVIGDTVDDAVSAARAGARCVLYASGQHSLEALRAVGVPVVGTLHEALAIVLGNGGGPGNGSVPAGQVEGHHTGQNQQDAGDPRD